MHFLRGQGDPDAGALVSSILEGTSEGEERGMGLQEVQLGEGREKAVRMVHSEERVESGQVRRSQDR